LLILDLKVLHIFNFFNHLPLSKCFFRNWNAAIWTALKLKKYRHMLVTTHRVWIGSNVTKHLKVRIVDPENASIAIQQPVNTFPRQPKYAPASTAQLHPGYLSPSNSLLKTSPKDRRILGSGMRTDRASH
jgi:hypothetical protein